MINILIILKGLLLGWFISEFQPLQEFIKKYIKPSINRSCKPDNIIQSHLKIGLSCIKCLAFHSTWIIGLITTQDFLIFEAITASILAIVLDKLLNIGKIYL